MYTLMHVGSPVTNTQGKKWKTYSEHSDRGDGFRALAKAKRDMRERCGASGWDDHFKLVDDDGKEAVMTEKEYYEDAFA